MMLIEFPEIHQSVTWFVTGDIEGSQLGHVRPARILADGKEMAWVFDEFPDYGFPDPSIYLIVLTHEVVSEVWDRLVHCYGPGGSGRRDRENNLFQKNLMCVQQFDPPPTVIGD